MVPMTVSFFTRKGQNRAKGLGMAALFGLSIVALYVLIGVVVSRLFGGDVANDIATHWLPNVLFFAIFLTFGFSFLGYFEITLPSAWSTATDERAEKGGVVGVFFMALTLVVVSFSCTGPIASGILLASSQGAVIQPVVAMLGFSLAFALPFTFFAAFPHAMQALPRSGSWMNSVKVVLGFVELALALKFLSVADLAYHWHILDREVYLALWIVIFAMLGFYLLGKIKLPHDDADEKPVGWVALSLSILVFGFVFYLIPGLWGAPLKALSGYLPPLETQDFRPNSASTSTQITTTPAPQAGCPTPKYADFLHLPHGIDGYYDLDQALACAKASGKPVFIDFTGHGCTNCREMEARVWSNPNVLSRLKEKFVVCALYVDDRTALPENEQYISQVDGKLKATIGKRNLDLEVSRFNSNAQPQYIILAPDGTVRQGPRPYNLDVAAFEQFLDAGL
jgi:thiol:disulfide interchange protein DsbD